ncbi:MAG: hypothetical protein M1814_004058 [Vezdaea aestivalis]|nr:MAG: hypothetical protein M1814_004058 [Vezdaea aestivalis]
MPFPFSLSFHPPAYPSPLQQRVPGMPSWPNYSLDHNLDFNNTLVEVSAPTYLCSDLQEALLNISRISEIIDRSAVNSLDERPYRSADGRSALTNTHELKTRNIQEIFPYLAQRNWSSLWDEHFRKLSGSLFQQIQISEGDIDRNGTRFKIVGEIKHDAHSRCRASNDIRRWYDFLCTELKNQSSCLPYDVKRGIEDRLFVLDSFLEATEQTFKANHGQLGLNLRENDQEAAIFKVDELRQMSELVVRPTHGIFGALNSEATILTIWGLFTVVATIVQAIAFTRGTLTTLRNPGSQPSATSPDCLTSIQQLLSHTLSLYLSLLPATSTNHFRDYFGLWTWIFAATSMALGTLAPIFYVFLSPAWCGMVGLGANLCQAFVTLQLNGGIRAIQVKGERATR